MDAVRGVSEEITEQHPDERIAWRSTTGVDQAGVVTFHQLDAETTRVTLQLEMEPEGRAGGAPGRVTRARVRVSVRGICQS